MGYYANGSGCITYKRTLTEEEYNRIDSVLRETFEVDGLRTGIHGKSYFDIWDDDKYYDDDVVYALCKAASLAPIEEGYIEYAGEDSCFWRFIYFNGCWHEQNGNIVYDEPGYIVRRDVN